MKVFIKSEFEAKKLGDNIKIARKRRDLSLVELASKSSISKTALGRIEAGDPSVGVGKILNVLDALGLLDGLANLINPELDRQQTIQEILNLREGKHQAKKNNLVRFIN